MARPKRKEREVERTRIDIIEAAARVIAKSGVEAASMQEIAREAGYSAPSLYAYFAGKEAIVAGLVALMEDEFGRLFDRSSPASLTFPQRLELLLRDHFEWAHRRRDAFFALMSLGVMARPGASGQPQAQRDSAVAYAEHLQVWLKGNARKTDLPGAGYEEAATVLWGLSQAFFQKWLRSDGKQTAAAIAARVVEIFLHGIGGASPQDGKGVR